MALRFHLDESVNPAIAKGLRLRGIDCSTAQEAGLSGVSDEEQLAFAAAHHRILVTTDDDFLTLASCQAHAGVVYWHQEWRTIGEAIRRLVKLQEQHAPEAVGNKVVFL